MTLKSSFKAGIGFGLTSGVITTLGLMIGLYAGTHLKFAVIGGILMIAFEDAFADALGIHISREAEVKYSNKSVWEVTFITFFTKLIIALSFLIPVLLFNLQNAIIISVFWGFLLLTLFSFKIALERKANAFKIVFEHLIIAIIVIIITYYLGKFISGFFGVV